MGYLYDNVEDFEEINEDHDDYKYDIVLYKKLLTMQMEEYLNPPEEPFEGE